MRSFLAGWSETAPGFLTATPTRAEYGDVVINNYSDAAGMRPAVFPHWFHRIRFRCKVCHAELGFKMRAGSNLVRMSDIIDIDTGSIITGDDTPEGKGAAILDYLIEVASGREIPKAVALGQDDFIPWKRGVSL